MYVCTCRIVADGILVKFVYMAGPFLGDSALVDCRLLASCDNQISRNAKFHSSGAFGVAYECVFIRRVLLDKYFEEGK